MNNIYKTALAAISGLLISSPSITAGQVPVSIEMNFDAERYTASGVNLVGVNGRSWVPIQSNEQPATTDLEEGTYDMIAEFSLITPVKNLKNRVYIVKEKVEVGSEPLSLEFDASEAVNRIDFKDMLPDGTEGVLSTVDTEGNPVAQGNITLREFHIEPLSLEYGSCISSGSSTGKTTVTDQITYSDHKAIYVNNFSDRIAFSTITLLYEADETAYEIGHWVTAIKGNATMANDPKGYVSMKPEFTPTGMRDVKGQFEQCWELLLRRCYKGHTSAGVAGVKIHAGKPQVSICLPSQMCDPEGFMLLNALGYADACTPSSGRIPAAYYNIYTPFFGVVDGRLTLVHNNRSHSSTYLFQEIDPALGTRSELPYHPDFSISMDDMDDCVMGNTSPLLVVACKNYNDTNDPDILHSTFVLQSVGRKGELRDADIAAIPTPEVRYNGEPVEINGSFGQWCNSWAREKHEPGVMEYRFVNSNARIDGLPVENTTVIKVDNSKSDRTAPTLTMLQLRDINGRVTERFGNLDDAVIMLSGSDFTYNVDDNRSEWLSHAPMAVKVEAAAEGSDKWQDVEMTEQPSHLMMPLYGSYFTGSLSSLDKPASGQWYKLRVTLTDPTGNSQQQTLSHAFRSEAWSGLTNIAPDTEATIRINGNRVSAQGCDIKVLTIDGRVAASGRDNITIPRPGLYIVNAGGVSTKVTVK